MGRGLRLAVDGSGGRVHDPDVNRLTVVAGETYAGFVGALQREAFRLPGCGNARPLPPVADGRGAAPRTPPATGRAARPTDRVYARGPGGFLAEVAALVSVESGRVALGEAGLELLDRRRELRVVAPDLSGPG